MPMKHNRGGGRLHKEINSKNRSGEHNPSHKGPATGKVKRGGKPKTK